MSTETWKQMIEKYFALIAAIIYWVVSIVLYYFPLSNLELNLIIYNHLMEKNDMIVTFATVMIGIYFTIYTLLLTKDILTKYLNFSLNNIKSLLSQLSVAFFISFLYVLFSIVGIEISSYMFYTIVIGMIIMLFWSSFQVGLILILIFNERLQNYGELLNEKERKEKQSEELNRKLTCYLAEKEIEKEIARNEEIRKK